MAWNRHAIAQTQLRKHVASTAWAPEIRFPHRLEVACGTGRLNTFLRDAYPTLDVSAVDLSPCGLSVSFPRGDGVKEGTKRRFYLEEARGHAKRWEAFRRRTQPSQRVGTAKFAQANAEKLPHADESFDVVVNVYLFHELPHEARRAAAREMARVCMLVWKSTSELGRQSQRWRGAPEI